MQKSITQGTMTCIPFNTELPVLHTPEGDFIPIRALCTMLGLAPAVWIGVVCQRYYSDPDSDPGEELLRRLPWRADDGVHRVDWCLTQERVGQWIGEVNPKHVHGERHDQLVDVQREMMHAVSALYDRMQADFATAKQRVYEGLQACERSQQALARTRAWLHEHLGHSPGDAGEKLRQLDEVMACGNAAYEAYADALRRALKKMVEQPVVDAVIVKDGEVVDTVAMPILPSVPDMTEVDRCKHAITVWTKDLAAWSIAQGFEVSWEAE